MSKDQGENVNHICRAKTCACAGGPNVWDECCCIHDGAGTCRGCGDQLEEIDVNTGEPTVPRAT